MSLGELGEWLTGRRPLLEKNVLTEKERKSEEIAMKAIMERVGQRSEKERHLNAKKKEIELALGGEDVDKKMELVKQTEELIELAHQLTYH